MATKTVSAVEARHNLGHLLNLVSLTHCQVIIERAGKKIATLSEYSPNETTQNNQVSGGKLDICNIEGVGKEIWSEVQVEAYVRQERESWE